MKPNAVFYLSESCIKFLQVAPGSRLVTALDVLNIQGQNDDQISGLLSAWARKQKPALSSGATLVIPRSRAMVRYLSLPSHKDEEIRSMVDLQIAGHIPYVREDVELDVQVLSKTADGYAKVMVVLVPRDIALRAWTIFSQAKIPVRAMTVSSSGLALLGRQCPDVFNKAGAVFDVDTDRTEICLCGKSQWLASREVAIGFVQMQETGYGGILQQWELTQQAAGAEKLNPAVEAVFVVSSTNRSAPLAIEIGNRLKGAGVKEVFLTKILKLGRGLAWPRSMTDEGLSMAALAGVALAPAPAPIDLVPASVKQERGQKAYRRQVAGLGGWLVVALVSSGVALGVGLWRQNGQLSRLQDEVYAAKRQASQVGQLVQKIGDVQRMIKGRLVFSDLARQLDKALPPQVYLVNITISGGNTLSLEGVSSNSVDINQLEGHLSASPLLSNVGLAYVNRRATQQGEVDYFKITATLNVQSP